MVLQVLDLMIILQMVQMLLFFLHQGHSMPNYVHSTGVITDNSTGNIFSGASTADGTREIIVQGASKRTTSTITTVAGNNIVVSVIQVSLLQQMYGTEVVFNQ